MITKIKAVAAALIAIAGIITSNAAQAADRIPDELLGCWKYVKSGLGIRNPNSIYSRVDSEDCKGQMLISSDGWGDDGLTAYFVLLWGERDSREEPEKTRDRALGHPGQEGRKNDVSQDCIRNAGQYSEERYAETGTARQPR